MTIYDSIVVKIINTTLQHQYIIQDYLYRVTLVHVFIYIIYTTHLLMDLIALNASSILPIVDW